jgi:hypothetical protein
MRYSGGNVGHVEGTYGTLDIWDDEGLADEGLEANSRALPLEEDISGDEGNHSNDDDMNEDRDEVGSNGGEYDHEVSDQEECAEEVDEDEGFMAADDGEDGDYDDTGYASM